MTNRTKARCFVWGCLACILVLGSYFRLANLGLAALRGDTIEFWKICSRPLSAGQIFSQWTTLMGSSGQFPFAMATTKCLIDLFHLPVTEFALRLPSALWGIATIFIAYCAGKCLAGRKVGLALSLLVAMNPYLIQISREAYFYPPMILGSFLSLLGMLMALQRIKTSRERRFTTYLLVNASGFFLLTYSSPAGWSMALLSVVLVSGCEIWKMVRRRLFRGAFVFLAYGIIGVPLLVAPWALKQIRQISSAEHVAHTRRVFGGSQDSILEFLLRVMGQFAWGQTPLRTCFLAGILGLALLVVVGEIRRKHSYWLYPYLFAGVIGFFLLSVWRTAVPLQPRYVVSLIPIYLSFLALGPCRISRLGFLRRRLPRVGRIAVPWLAGVSSSLLLLQPAIACTRMTGHPKPYKAIQQWVNENLPQGTPVLVDRWLDPWNELAVYQSTNVFFTFTVPNEPIDVYRKVNWRETATEFFAKYPDAAYLEIQKSFWKLVGPWHWPREHFSHRVEFSDEASRRLDEWGLATRGHFAVELFHSTPEEVVSTAKAEGKTSLLMYGPGWRYTKLWRQIRGDFRDWRVLTDQATLDLHNLTADVMAVKVKIQAVGFQGTKRVECSGQTFTFPSNQGAEWEIGPLVLQTGKNSVRLTDSSWGTGQIALLVADVRFEEVPAWEK